MCTYIYVEPTSSRRINRVLGAFDGGVCSVVIINSHRVNDLITNFLCIRQEVVEALHVTSVLINDFPNSVHSCY